MHTTYIKIQDDSEEKKPEVIRAEVFEDTWDIEIGHYDRFYHIYPDPMDKSKLAFDTYNFENTEEGLIISERTIKTGSLTP